MTQIDLTEDSIHIEVSGSLDVADYISDIPFNEAIDGESTAPIVSLALAFYFKEK